MKAEDLILYAVTDRSWLKVDAEVAEELAVCSAEPLSTAEVPEAALRAAMVADVKKALDGGVSFVQLREKHLSYGDFLAEALDVKTLCAEYGVPFVINDNVELALACGADGVHVGQSDMACREARAKLGPDAIVGVSARTVEQAKRAEAEGASYLGVGAVFHTGSKADAKDLPHDTVRAITEAVSIPCIGIGGITKDNVAELSGLGLKGIAVISAVFAQNDIKAATEELKDRTKAALDLKREIH